MLKQVLNKQQQQQQNAKQKTETHKEKKFRKIYLYSLKIFNSSLVIDFIIFIHIFDKQI